MVSIINTEYKRKNKIDRGKDTSSPLCNFCGRSKKNLARRGEETSYLVWDLESIPEVIHIWTLLLLGHFVSEDKHISRFLNYCTILELILELLVFLTAKSLQLCPTLCNPIDGSPPDSPTLGFSKQEHWSGLPFPSPVHKSEKWKWSCSVVSDSLRPHGP